MQDVECAIYRLTGCDDVATVTSWNSHPETQKDSIADPRFLKFREEF